MKPGRRGALLLHFALLLACFACRGDYELGFSITIENEGKAPISDAEVSFADFESIGGRIDPGLSKTHLDIRGDIPQEVTVSWRLPDGRSMRETVPLRDKVGAGFRGRLRFVISGSSLRLEVEA